MGSAGMIKKVCEIVLSGERELVVVVSAIGDTTDLLERAIESSVDGSGDYMQPYNQMKQKHLDMVRALFPSARQPDLIGKMHLEFKKGGYILEGIHMLNEASAKSKDRILSIGEQVSALILSEYMNLYASGVKLFDATELIHIRPSGRGGEVVYESTMAGIRRAWSGFSGIGVVPGFIGGGEDGSVRTLGRGGSDLTASLISEALEAELLTLWSDVSGMYTADPRIVPDAFCIDKVSYEEALEMSYFGAGVLYPPSVLPALRSKIPIDIKNTFQSDNPGTQIREHTQDHRIVKGLSSISNISMVTLIGGGMVGVAGIASRTFSCLSELQISVIFISQSSSEHSICMGIQTDHLQEAVNGLKREFAGEINSRMIDSVIGESGFAIIALVGQNMLNTPGISGKLFQSLGYNGINVHAIAQGSSERNISAIIKAEDVSKALNLLHEDFFLSDRKKIHLFVAGTGNVGEQFIRLIEEQQEDFRSEFNLEFVLAGISNSRKMLIREEGIAWDRALQELDEQGKQAKLDDFFKEMTSLNLRNSVFVDNTASEDVGNLYERVLEQSISIATCNKI